MVEWLLDRGADINLEDEHSRSALFHALQLKHDKIAMKSLEWKPTFSALTSIEQTLLESAMEYLLYTATAGCQR